MANLTPDERSSLQHWSIFGRPGEPATKRVTATDWGRNNPIEKPATAKWDQTIPRAELPKLLNGFRPEAMEDKWFVYADGPDAEGHATLHMFRSWTGNKTIEAKIVVEMGENGEIADKDSYFTEITWETDEEKIRGHTEEQAKENAIGVCRWCMGAKLP